MIGRLTWTFLTVYDWVRGGYLVVFSGHQKQKQNRRQKFTLPDLKVLRGDCTAFMILLYIKYDIV